MEASVAKLAVVTNGIPTDIELNKMLDAFGIPEEGRLITHGDIASLTGTEYGTPRYMTVVNRWKRHLMREHNVFMNSVRGEGYMAAKPSERIGASGARYNRGIRNIVFAGTIAGSTDVSRLTAQERAARDHYANAAATLRLAQATAPRPATPPQLELGEHRRKRNQ